MSHEIELKFQVPASALARVRRAVTGRGTAVQSLLARYFDTEDARLAGARTALRLRLEGPHWVQTLKAEGERMLQRLEHNVTLPVGAEARLDITRHDGTPAGRSLRQALAAGGLAPLLEQWRTQIQRTSRRVRHRGATIELALDEGEIQVGDARLLVCELEMELLEGPAPALLDFAALWAKRHGLWLDVRSKSERGLALRAAQSARVTGAVVPTPAPARARLAGLRADMSGKATAQALLTPVLQAALANAAALADGTGTPEHLHQLRVAMRRLRAVFRAWPDLWPAEQLAQVSAPLAALLSELGTARDADVLAHTLKPEIEAAAGAPALAWPEHREGSARDAGPTLRSAPAQALWLGLLGLSWASSQRAAQGSTAAGSLPAQLMPAIRRLARQVQRGASHVEALDVESLHRLRRRIKRLRYLLDGSAGLWPSTPLGRWVRRLADAQDALGRLNDLVAAQAPCRAWAEQHGPAWFVVGWLAATIGQQRQALRRPMRMLVRLKRLPSPPRT